MAMITPPHLSFEVHEASQVGEARRAAVQWAANEGFNEVDCGRVALVVTELGTNLVRHATQGRMLIGLAADDDGGRSLEVLALDRGPGIADWRACMADGYSTGGTSGTGLGAVRRLADVFDAYSAVPAGTVIMARVRGAVQGEAAQSLTPAVAPHERRIEVGALALAAPGERVCGDAWSVQWAPGRAALFMADGLGHGPEAAQASTTAQAVFEKDAMGAPSLMLDRMHQSMRSTRGAAVLVAQLDALSNEISYCGIGNIAGRVMSGVEDRSLMSQHGTVGLQMRRPVDTGLPWPQHALLVLHSDGLATRWTLDDAPGLLQRHPTLIAAWLVRGHTRGRDDVSVLVAKKRLT